MKKVFFSLFLLGAISLGASAQTAEVKQTDKKTKVETPTEKVKVKKTSTPKQKVHNLLHPKRKRYSGVKVKHHMKKD